jgi:drug/metabolite transporter (DMT)-like permease
MSHLGELSALVTAVCWTGSALSFAAATVRAGSVYVNVTRMAAALILLAVTIVALNLSLDLTLGQVLFLASSGLVGFAFGDTFLFRSYEHNSARITSLIMSTAPAISAVIGYMALDERLSLLAWLGMFVTLSGIALVIQEGRNGAPAMRQFTRAGVIFALLASVGQAGGLVLAKKAFLIGPVDGFVATFVRLGAAIAVVLPLNVLTGRYRQPVKVFAADRKAFALTIIGAFFGPFLGVTFSLIAIANTSVAIAATIMATVPVLMLPTVRVVHKEVLTWRSVVGALAAVAGVALLFAD